MDNFMDVLNETTKLAKQNMVMKRRLGKNMFFITPTHREPPIEYYKKQEVLLQEFNLKKKSKKIQTIFPYIMNDVIQVSNKPKLEHIFPELVIHDFSFNWKRK